MKLIILVLISFFAFSVNGQIIPVPGSNLIHTQVMFEYPVVKNAVIYEIEISIWDSLRKVSVPFMKQFDNTTATLVSNLNFGFEYRWKYLAFDKKQKTIFTSQEYVFYIKKVQEVNAAFQRVRLNPVNCQDSLKGLITFDYCKTIVDRYGIPVCYVPEVPPILNKGFSLRDLRITRGGTISLLAKMDAIEMDLNGNIIWIAPNDGKVSGEETETYHHVFSKLENGNYLILSNKHHIVKAPNDTVHINAEFGTVIEYDLSGNVVWKWDSFNYFSIYDLFTHKRPDNTYEVTTHCNSLDISKDFKYIFLGFRDISRIIKIEKVSGKVVASFGAKMPSGEAAFANNFFRFQHGGNILSDSTLVVFNNDSIKDPEKTSSVVIFSQPTIENPSSKLLWNFNCKFDSLTDGKSEKTGNVIELPNRTLLVNMGAINRTIEITRDKNIVWDAFTEKWNMNDNKWEAFPQYRSSYISSLYPCYFTVSLSKNVTKKGMLKNATLNIFNEGTETDQYKIIIEKGNEITEFLSQNVIPDNSIKFSITTTPLEDISKIKLISSLDNRRYRSIDFKEETQESSLNSLPSISVKSYPNIEGAKSGK